MPVYVSIVDVLMSYKPPVIVRDTTEWIIKTKARTQRSPTCLLYTSDAADERSSVDLGGRRIIKKKKKKKICLLKKKNIKTKVEN